MSTQKYSVSGLFGYGDAGATNSYYLGSTNDPATGERTEGALKQQATFVGWDFDEIWGIDEGGSFSYLRPSDTLGGYVYLNATAGNQYMVSLKGFEIASFENATFKLAYDPSILQLVDFAAQTLPAYTAAGPITDTPLEIISHSSGVLTFSVSKAIPPGHAWSGNLTALRFEAVGTGEAQMSITYLS